VVHDEGFEEDKLRSGPGYTRLQHRNGSGCKPGSDLNNGGSQKNKKEGT
jgi:hypothetical protein